jgi:16S rRNA (cytidine1402-2'-O)-methyltransferase
MEGILYIVSTPIGNMEDITLRAIKTLNEVDLVAAEDTRHTMQLFARHGIHTKLISYHQHSRITKIDFLIEQLREGKNIALVSDAGTPGISDPGEVLIKRVIEEGIKVVPIPGPSTVITALTVSGLPAANFIFLGFLKRKSGARQNQLAEFKNSERTVVIYESPHRVLDTLADIRESLGERQVAVGRELTKKFEEVKRGRVSEVLEYFSSRPVLGEFCLVIGGKEGRKNNEESV